MTKKRAFLAMSCLLHCAREFVPGFVGAEGAVEQEGAAFDECAEHVVALEEYPLVAGDEVGFGDEIGGVDGIGAEAQMRGGHGAGFLGVVDEVALSVVGRVFADDLDGVLVRADGAVGAEAVELGADDRVGLGGEGWIVGQAGVAEIVVDANGEVGLSALPASDCRRPP